MCRHSERSIYPDQHGIRVLASTEGEELLPSHLSLSSFVLRAPLVLACCVTAVGRRGVHHHMGNVTASIQQEKSTQVEEEMGLVMARIVSTIAVFQCLCSPPPPESKVCALPPLHPWGH